MKNEETHTGIDWFNENIKPLLGNDFEIKYIYNQDGDLGDLAGVQFDSEERGGYIYFWSCGFVGFQLVNYITEIELIEDTTQEIKSRSYDEMFKNFILILHS